MAYEEIVYFLFNCNQKHSVLDVKRCIDLLKLDINPNKVVLVAGTNGKGSTSISLSYLLNCAHKNVGFFSSPHIEKVNERIKFNNIDISDKDFEICFNAIHSKCGSYRLSCFEYLTLMACYYFFHVHHNVIDFAIFEVGLGGTLDATNAIAHSFSVITKLGLDHEDILGKSTIEIAKNKFGIISRNNIVFHTKFPTNIIQLKQNTNARFIEAYKYQCIVEYCSDTNANAPIFKIKNKFGIFTLNLQGKRAAENASLAITVFDYLLGHPKNIAQYLDILKTVYWPGRMELMHFQNQKIYLSGDHNPQGVASLIEILKHYNFDTVHIVVGICYDKNHTKMINKLCKIQNAVIYVTQTPVKTLSINDYNKQVLSKVYMSDENHIMALQKAISNCKKNDIIVVTGSLYLVGAMKTYILNN